MKKFLNMKFKSTHSSSGSGVILFVVTQIKRNDNGLFFINIYI